MGLSFGTMTFESGDLEGHSDFIKLDNISNKFDIGPGWTKV